MKYYLTEINRSIGTFIDLYIIEALFILRSCRLHIDSLPYCRSMYMLRIYSTISQRLLIFI